MIREVYRRMDRKENDASDLLKSERVCTEYLQTDGGIYDAAADS